MSQLAWASWSGRSTGADGAAVRPGLGWGGWGWGGLSAEHRVSVLRDEVSAGCGWWDGTVASGVHVLHVPALNCTLGNGGPSEFCVICHPPQEKLLKRFGPTLLFPGCVHTVFAAGKHPVPGSRLRHPADM